MANYEEARVKLTNMKLNKLKSAAKDKTGTTLRIRNKKFQDEELPRELFPITRQKTKRKNAFTKNILMDKKLSKAQLSEIIQSGRFLDNMMSNLVRKVLTDVFALLVGYVLPHLAYNATTSSILGKFERRISGQGAVRAGKRFTLFISNEDMDDIIKTVESLENSGLLNDGASKTVKHEIKRQEGGFHGAMMAPMTASLIAPMVLLLIHHIASSPINAITGGVM